MEGAFGIEVSIYRIIDLRHRRGEYKESWDWALSRVGRGSGSAARCPGQSPRGHLCAQRCS
jgi:hypothetical protein